jgi:hypothetical protein
MNNTRTDSIICCIVSLVLGVFCGIALMYLSALYPAYQFIFAILVIVFGAYVNSKMTLPFGEYMLYWITQVIYLAGVLGGIYVQGLSNSVGK